MHFTFPKLMNGFGDIQKLKCSLSFPLYFLFKKKSYKMAGGDFNCVEL